MNYEIAKRMSETTIPNDSDSQSSIVGYGMRAVGEYMDAMWQGGVMKKDTEKTFPEQVVDDRQGAHDKEIIDGLRAPTQTCPRCGALLTLDDTRCDCYDTHPVVT